MMTQLQMQMHGIHLKMLSKILMIVEMVHR